MMTDLFTPAQFGAISRVAIVVFANRPASAPAIAGSSTPEKSWFWKRGVRPFAR